MARQFRLLVIGFSRNPATGQDFLDAFTFVRLVVIITPGGSTGSLGTYDHARTGTIGPSVSRARDSRARVARTPGVVVPITPLGTGFPTCGPLKSDMAAPTAGARGTPVI